MLKYWGYLIATLSLLVSWAGISTWKIVSYLIHQHRSIKQEKDILDTQLQVLLRQSSGASRTVVDVVKLQRTWIKYGKRVNRRTWPVILIVDQSVTNRGGASAFIDDYFRWKVGRSAKGNLRELQEDILRIEKWARENGAQFAADKTELIHFTRRKEEQTVGIVEHQTQHDQSVTHSLQSHAIERYRLEDT
jgi:hypothetical protein